MLTGWTEISTPDYFTVKYKPVATAVELLGFEAIGRDGSIDLRWQTEVEVDNYKWLLTRSEEKDGNYKKIAELDAKGDGPIYKPMARTTTVKHIHQNL